MLPHPQGWTVIDTGSDTSACRQVWDELIDTILAGQKVRRLVATHGHTDHVGLAGWLTQRWSAEFVATLSEWMSAQVRIYEANMTSRPEVVRFLSEHGCDAETIEAWHQDRARHRDQLGIMPPTLRRIRDGQTIAFGGRDWQVITCGGHAIEHASFYSAADKILIAGDQVLSRISPMIGVFPNEPLANPLADYLESLDRFRALPADTFVLPSHGMPFYGLHARLDQLAHHHRIRLDQLDSLLDRPRGSMALTNGLFPKAVAEGQGRLALSETIAHAHFLVSQGRATRTVDDAGHVMFARSGS
jgi:glyoxylase-like metal-dependent hydrolase (beta-lactamase superfamily II)